MVSKSTKKASLNTELIAMLESLACCYETKADDILNFESDSSAEVRAQCLKDQANAIREKFLS